MAKEIVPYRDLPQFSLEEMFDNLVDVVISRYEGTLTKEQAYQSLLDEIQFHRCLAKENGYIK